MTYHRAFVANATLPAAKEIAGDNLMSARRAIIVGLLLAVSTTGAAQGTADPTGLQWGGLIEVEASHGEDFAGVDQSDLVLATVEFGASAVIAPRVRAQATLLFEEDETDLEIDQATVTLGIGDGERWSVELGRMYVPFGRFESGLIVTPLTLDLGETRETAIALHFDGGSASASIYAFNGDTRDGAEEHIEHYGLRLSYGRGLDDGGYSLALDYTSNLADSDSLQDAVATSPSLVDTVAGTALSLQHRRGQFSIMAEYVSALERFAASELAFGSAGAEPSAWQLELAYGLRLGSLESTLRAGAQGSSQAQALGLAETRSVLGLSLDLRAGTALAFELTREEDYGPQHGGTGRDAKGIAVQLAVEF